MGSAVATVATIGSAVGGLVAVAVLVALVVAGGAVWALRRRSVDDRHSVDHYQRTLRTLQGIGSRGPGGEGAPPSPSSPSAITSARQRRALASVERRPGRRRALLAGFVVLAAAAVTLGGVLEARSPGHGDRAPSSAPRHDAVTPTTSRAPTPAASRPASSQTPTTTTTTLPARYAPVSSSDTAATYTVPATYSLSLAATTGACWVQVTGATGAALLSQTLSSGATQSIAVSGGATILIGAPSVVAVEVDGAPVVLPPVAHAPFSVTLSPGASG